MIAHVSAWWAAPAASGVAFVSGWFPRHYFLALALKSNISIMSLIAGELTGT
jgi:hypothetical protein